MSEEKIQEYGIAIRLRNRMEAETGKVHEIIIRDDCYMVREYETEERRAA